MKGTIYIIVQVNHFEKVPFGQYFIKNFDRLFYTAVHTVMWNFFKFFNAMANKTDFLSIIYL